MDDCSKRRSQVLANGSIDTPVTIKVLASDFWLQRQRINDFLRVANAAKVVKETDNFDKELQAATESILEEIQSQNQVSILSYTYN